LKNSFEEGRRLGGAWGGVPGFEAAPGKPSLAQEGKAAYIVAMKKPTNAIKQGQIRLQKKVEEALETDNNQGAEKIWGGTKEGESGR